MNKYFNTITNTRGDSLPGYRVQVVDDNGAVVTIYSDSSGSRFTDNVGNVVNYTEADSEGFAEFYWTPAMGQALQVLDKGGDLVRSIADFASIAASADISATQAEASASAAAASASAASSSASAAAGSATSASTTLTETQAVKASTEIVLSDTQAVKALADVAKAGAESARDAALAYRDGTLAGSKLFPSKNAAVGNGVIGHGAITGGSGGTDGTFTTTTTGGTVVVPAQVTFTVSGGAVTSVTITKGGYYTANPTGFDFSPSSGLTGASATPTVGANTVNGEAFQVPSASGEGYVDLHTNNSGAASAIIATLPNKSKLDSIGPDRIAAALDGNGWLAADALTLTGAAAGLTWNSTHLAIAKAIKEIEVTAVASRNSEDWYIATFANADATNKDQFIVLRASDNAVVGSFGQNDAVRRPDGLGEIAFSFNGGSIRAVIDYSALSTGVLLNSGTKTPLLISKKNASSVVTNRALLDASPNFPWRNKIPNGNFDPDRTLTTAVSAPVFASPPTSDFMADRGVDRALRVGTGGSSLIYVDSGPIFTAADAHSGRWLFMSVFAYSANGTTWPNLRAYFYKFSGGAQYTSQSLTSYIEIDANNRLYFFQGKLPQPSPNSDLIGGFVRIGQDSNQTGAGTELQFGGMTLMTADRPLHLSNTRKDDWYPEVDSAAALGDLAGAISAAGAAFAGKTIVFLGDSIMDDYGIPENVAAKLGATVKNFAWEGTRLAKRASGNYQSRDGVSIAEAVAADDFTQLVADVNTQYPTGSDFHVTKRATAAEMAAFDWSTADFIVCAWGTNDYGGGVNLGATTSTTHGEFNGALNEFLRIMQGALKSAQIVFCTPAFRNTSPDSETDTNGAGLLLQAYVDAIKDRAEKRGHCPVIDLHKTLGINAYNASIYYADTLHPNTGAGQERWASRIAAGLSGFVR